MLERVHPKPRPRARPSGRYLAREAGALAFNRRVFAQAQDRSVPLLERLRFLCIVSSNLDELFEIRVAELKERIKLGNEPGGPGELAPSEVLRAVCEQAHALIASQYKLLNKEILPALEDENVFLRLERDWSTAQHDWLHEYFMREIIPVLTPIGLDPSHPFPRVFNKSLNFAVQIEGRDAFGRNSNIAIVQAPRLLPRLIRLPRGIAGKGQHFVYLTAVLQAFVAELFPGMAVLGSWPFRLTRNSDLFLDDEEIKDLRTALQGELPQRHFGDSVRLELSAGCPPAMEDFLLHQFELTQDDLYRVDGPVNLVRLMQLPDMVDIPHLKYPPFQPSTPKQLEEGDLFRCIAEGDILLHHPYQSFNPVIEMLEQAAEDPDVVAIKQTVYRTGTDSVLMKYLIDAAQRGKEVTVVVELLARFDEEANLNWASRLEDVGAHVVYGVVGYKTHAKMLMVVRREKGELRRYVHLGTGNYHPRTARMYTDFGLFTADPVIGKDVDDAFKQLTGPGKRRELRSIWMSPFTLHDHIIESIRREARHARAGRKAHIIAKMNALLEQKVIEALYAASEAGVKIDLIVRGMCALRPGVEGMSSNIRVRSIVGQFLEHHRVFYFYNHGAEDVYLSSADWMERNFFRRVELCVPVLNKKLKARVIKEGLKVYLADNVQAWDMDGEGNYERRRPRNAPKPAQERLIALLSRSPQD